MLIDVNIHSHEHSLSLDFATVNGLCQLTPNFRATGAVTLSGAKIHGHLATQGAQFLGDKTSFNAGGMQLAGQMLCDGSFFLADCTVTNATVKGNCSFGHTQFGDQGFGGKLSLLGTTTGGNLDLSRGLYTRGEIELSQVRVEGNLTCHGLYASVLQGTRLTVLGDLDWRSVHVYEEGWLILDNAAIGCLRDDEFSWPEAGRLRLHRAKIGKLILHQAATLSEKEGWTEELPFSVEKRIKWLNLQENAKSLDSFSWIQVAEMLKATGDAAGARSVIRAYRRHEAYAEYLANWPSSGGFIPPDLNRRVFLAKRWVRIRAEISRATLIWRLRRQLAVFEWEPMLILAVIVAFTLLGAVVFWPMEGRFAPTSTDAYKASVTPVAKRETVAPYPKFSPFIY